MACSGRAGCPGLIHLPSVPRDIVPLCGSRDDCIAIVVVLLLLVVVCVSSVSSSDFCF